MGIKERKERERDERIELILNAAEEIITNEGVEKLSVRKLARKIDYSPSIIYHYFKDKEDIVNQLMGKSYRKIIMSLMALKSKDLNPRDKIREATRGYINLALEMPETYKTVLLNQSPNILKHTAVLYEGAGKDRPTVQMMIDSIKEIYPDMDEETLELTTQILWSSMFGLIIRIIIEDVSDVQRNRLIDHYIEFMIEGIILGKK